MAAQRILVIDDEPGVRTALEGILEDEGFQVECVETGEQGLERLGDREFDAVLLDVERVIYELMGACSISTDGTDVRMTVEQEMPFIGVGYRDDGGYDIARYPFGEVWTKTEGDPDLPNRSFYF